ncbi:MAG: polysaccharide deacetylase, partial [bacterium]|nr:polysaccharide deacetylase [bacterium]
IMLELDDVHALWERRVPVARYGTLLKDSFRRLYRDGAQSGRLLVLHLHPWLIGQPFRIRYLDDALQFITRHQGAWMANGTSIIDWFRQHPPAAD